MLFHPLVLGDHVTNYNHYICTTTISMASKLDRMVTYLDCLLSVKSNGSIITWFFEITWQTKTLYFHYHNDFGHKTWQVMTYLELLLPVKSHDHKIKLPCKWFWQTNIIISLLTQCLWLSFLAGWGYAIKILQIF